MEKGLIHLAKQIDDAADDGNIERLRDLLDHCASALEDVCEQSRPILHFYTANCYSAIADLNCPKPNQSPDWHQDARIPEVLSLRRAIAEPSFEQLDDISKCKIYTNLGNRLNQLGRFVEAIRYWNAALFLIPSFAMALGNKGFGLSFYAKLLYDPNHRAILLAKAKESLKGTFQNNALWDSGYFPDIAGDFKNHHNRLHEHLEFIGYDYDFDFNQFPLGETKAEVSYRKWSLENDLFLSPLNDITQKSLAARDVLHLPTHTYLIGEEPRFPRYYNLLKQEYVTARFLLYQAIDDQWVSSQFSDKDVLLLEGYDGAKMDIHCEKLKTAYRMAYSIFDKISIFLNDYFDLDLRMRGLSFNSVWGNRDHGKFVLRPRFEGSQNWPLRGLYYLSKDLFDDGFKDVSLPEAQELASLRNRLEHRFVALQHFSSRAESTESLTYITIDKFQEKTLKIMSMAREALIYLSLSMHCEESMKPTDRSKLAMPIYSLPVERD